MAQALRKIDALIDELGAHDQKLRENSANTIILITGANKGIGYEFVKLCLTQRNDVTILIGCRSLNRIIQYDTTKEEQELVKQPDYWECLDNDGNVNKVWNDGKHTRKQILNAKVNDLISKSGNRSNIVDLIEMNVDVGSSLYASDEKLGESYAKARQSIDNGINYVKNKYGKIDILINNAGWAQKGDKFDFDVVTNTSSINYYGTKYVTEAVLKNQLIQGSKNGKIIFISSTAGSGFGFRRFNDRLKDKIVGTIEKGTESDLDSIMETFALATKGLKTKDKTEKVKLNDLTFCRSAYGMSKVGVSLYSRLVERDLSKKNVNNIGVAAYCPGMCKSYMSSNHGDRTSGAGAFGIGLLCFSQNLTKKGNNGQFWQLEDVKDDANAGEYRLYHTPWDNYMFCNDCILKIPKGAISKAMEQRILKVLASKH